MAGGVRAKALIFDVFGTLVDYRTSISREIETAFRDHGIPHDPGAISDAWRAEYEPSMARIRSGDRTYVALDVLHRENLETILTRFELDGILCDEAISALARAWERLTPWPDTVNCLRHLKQRAIVAPCSNGSIALMARLSRFAGLPWDCILGADLAKDYKPSPAVYLASCRALRLDPGEVMMIAAHNDDLGAAAECGLQTGFFPRQTEHGTGQSTDLEATGDWTVIARDMTDFASRLCR